MVRESIAVRALLISRSIQTIEFLCQHVQQLAIHIETCCDIESATRKLCRSKFEAVIIDFELGEEALQLLKKLRELTSHRHAISFAIVDREEDSATAFRANANFVLLRPLTVAPVVRTFRASYPMMFRERRRDYRYPIEVPVLVTPESDPEFSASSINISETGIAICSSTPFRVGAVVRLRIDLPDLPEPLSASGEVCWNDGNSRSGLRFIDVPTSLAERLQLWLFERMSQLVPGW